VRPMFNAGDRIRFPDPLLNEAPAEGTFVELTEELVEVKTRIGFLPSRYAAGAWVRRDDGTTECVIAAWIRAV
jgi:hypothetical protein